MLADGQLDIGKAFFRTTEIDGDTLDGYRFEPGAETGAPFITDSPWWFEFRVTDTFERGDHTLLAVTPICRAISSGRAVHLFPEFPR